MALSELTVDILFLLVAILGELLLLALSAFLAAAVLYALGIIVSYSIRSGEFNP